MTNLRLPGQYDERLLGPVGLQGPYHNWNRWYLPGVGRYLELDPISLRGIIDPRGRFAPHAPDWYFYARANPLRFDDPMGLTTYSCRKPLDALGGEGRRSGPDWDINPLFHAYVCTGDDGKPKKCGGKTERDGNATGPGRPSEDFYDPNRCKPISDDDCFEKCVNAAMENPDNRGWYNLVFSNCQDWVYDIVTHCRRQCGMR